MLTRGSYVETHTRITIAINLQISISSPRISLSPLSPACTSRNAVYVSRLRLNFIFSRFGWHFKETELLAINIIEHTMLVVVKNLMRIRCDQTAQSCSTTTCDAFAAHKKRNVQHFHKTMWFSWSVRRGCLHTNSLTSVCTMECSVPCQRARST